MTTIAPGQTIEIEGPARNLAGMIEVSQCGHSYALFEKDLQERAANEPSRH